MYSFELVSELVEFRKTREEWTELLENSVYDSFFCTHDWCYRWWESFATADDELAIITVRKENDLVAIAPFMIRSVREYGFSPRVLRFIGTPNSDRCDVIIRQGSETVIPELFAYIINGVKGWTQLCLNEVPAGSLFADFLKSNHKLLFVESGSDCPYVPLGQWASWEEFFASLSRKTRQELNRKNNALKKEGKSRYHHEMNPSIEGDTFSKARSLEISSAKAQRLAVENLALAGDEHIAFQARLSEGRGYGRMLTWLEREGEMIAYLYGYVYKNKYYAYNMAYSSEAVKYYPGKLVLNEGMRQCKENSIEEFDFLRGATYLKSKWTKESRQQENICYLKNNPTNWFYSFLVFWLRPVIKSRIIPLINSIRSR
jgi:hypothetical protein